MRGIIKKIIVIIFILFLCLILGLFIYNFILRSDTTASDNNNSKRAVCLTQNPKDYNNIDLSYYEKQDTFKYGKDIIKQFVKQFIRLFIRTTKQFIKKEDFNLPSNVIIDPNNLDPNKRYRIYNRRISNLQQYSNNYPPGLPGYTCPEFPDFLYVQI
jgi:hypothetical protein